MHENQIIHAEVSEHYEKYPYPDYPFFALGRWRDLESVDLSGWQIQREVRDLWICGSGTIAPLMFARRNPAVRIVATDLSRKTLNIARRRLALYGYHNVCLKQEDLYASQAVESFDAIDAFGVIHHVESPEKALRVLVTALRKGGVMRLMIYAADVRHEIEDLRTEVKRAHLMSLSEIKHFLKTKGVERYGDLKNDIGIADALLHPLVHVFDLKSVQSLISKFDNLDSRTATAGGNHLLFLRKK